MPADILVVTPSPTLGESIRRTLEETMLYRVHVVNNKASAVVRADEVGIPLAMLDLALGENWVQEVGTSLRTIHRGINMIILCDDGVTPPAFDDLRPWILVRKPFRMNDFMTAISQPQSAASTTPLNQNAGSDAPPWLSDENKAAQHLTRLTLSSSAQAALITRKNNLWAYAGGLSQDAAKELAQAVTRHWGGGDLLRFIRLESTRAEHMLYATLLAEDVVLAFVFDSETPFSTIRNQASQLVSDLDKFEAPKFSPPTQRIMEEQPSHEEYASEENIPPITNILTDIPAPNPSSKHEAAAPRKKPKFDPDETRVSDPLSNASVFERETSPSARLTPVAKREPAGRPASLQVRHQPVQTVLDDVEVTAPSRPQPRTSTPIAPPASKISEVEVTRENPVKERRAATPVAPPINSTDVTREGPTTQAARKLSVEPVSAGMYHLTYACLLVPRFVSHYITGDLSERMGEWLPNICIAFGWRLEYLSVRPEYLQWVVNVQPNTSPGYLMRIVRQQTSEKIFAEFPRLKKDNPSADFWAPGYLIMGGTQPHPQQLVNDYIRQTRQRQGQEIAP
jgi:REP element-mobilizing transposase RayT